MKASQIEDAKKLESISRTCLQILRISLNPNAKTDPTFHTTRLYRPITAKTTRDLLIEEYGYDPATMPHLRTISRKLDALKYWPRKVTKSKPLKKIPETNDIFDQINTINRDADENPGELRISLDAKARIKVGPFSRGGYSRQHKKGLDHDFDPDVILGLFGFFLPEYDDTHILLLREQDHGRLYC